MFKFAVYLCLAAITVYCMPQAPQSTPEGPPQPYEYQYKVENPPTNTFFGKNENGDQAGKVTGSYYVWLPDGRLMTVEYIADGEGYVPKISFQANANPLNSANPFTTPNPLASVQSVQG